MLAGLDVRFETKNGKNYIEFPHRKSTKKRGADKSFFKTKRPSSRKTRSQGSGSTHSLSSRASKRNLGLFGPSDEEKKLSAEIEDIKQQLVNLNMEEMLTENSKVVFTEMNTKMINLSNLLDTLSGDLVSLMGDKVDLVKEIADKIPQTRR